MAAGAGGLVDHHWGRHRSRTATARIAALGLGGISRCIGRLRAAVLRARPTQVARRQTAAAAAGSGCHNRQHRQNQDFAHGTHLRAGWAGPGGAGGRTSNHTPPPVMCKRNAVFFCLGDPATSAQVNQTESAALRAWRRGVLERRLDAPATHQHSCNIPAPIGAASSSDEWCVKTHYGTENSSSISTNTWPTVSSVVASTNSSATMPLAGTGSRW